MLSRWLVDLPSSSQWAALRSPEFREHPVQLAILPCFGFGDAGSGQSLDTEEILGTGLLRNSLAPNIPGIRVLPPFRFGPAPYAHQRFGLSLGLSQAWLDDIAQGIKAAGSPRLALFTTSPWHEEWAAAAAVDLRVKTGLEVFLLSLRSLGLDLHPASTTRRIALELAAAFGAGPVLHEGLTPSGRDARFRPGHFAKPTAPGPAGAEAPAAVLKAKAGLLRQLWGEMIGADAGAAAPTSFAAHPFAAGYRPRYLGGLTPGFTPSPKELGAGVVVLPTGAIEQHGPHLPLAVDSVLGQAFLEGALGHGPAHLPVWVAPPLAIGRSNEHAGFPGTLSVSTQTLQETVRQLVHGLVVQGARTIAVLNTHGGNSAVLMPLLRELQPAFGIRAGVIGGLFKPELTPQEAAYGFHAGEWETSLYLALDANSVRMGLAPCEYPARLEQPGLIRPEQAPATWAWKTSDISRTGVMGDATAATAAKGEQWLRAMGASLAARLEQISRGEP